MIFALGILGACLTMVSYFPQAWKIIKTRDTEGLSAPAWILSTVAFAVWAGYGILQAEWPIIIPNVICCGLAGFILTLKLAPKQTRDAIADKVVAATDAVKPTS